MYTINKSAHTKKSLETYRFHLVYDREMQMKEVLYAKVLNAIMADQM